MRPIPFTTLTAAVRTLNLPNVSSSSRDLALAALCFLRAAFLSAHFPRRFFRANPLRLSLSSRCFLPSQVLLAFVLPTCWVRHSHHTSTSPSSTLLLTRVCPPNNPSKIPYTSACSKPLYVVVNTTNFGTYR